MKGLMYSSIWFIIWFIIAMISNIKSWSNNNQAIFTLIVYLIPFVIYIKTDIDKRHKKIAEDYKKATGFYPHER
jgi:hypothetical protein